MIFFFFFRSRYRGVDKLLDAILKEWLEDIQSKQIGSVVSGLSVINILSLLCKSSNVSVLYDHYQNKIITTCTNHEI